MPLPTPHLDDRRAQDFVDLAKTLIPRYCPEWTDHNVHDPGITLIELFAAMTEMLLYRVNQVPDKNYIKFLELIGIRLAPPSPAHAPITFYLSAPQPNEVTIPADTEVATIRTETNPAIVFTTETDLVIRPVTLVTAFTRDHATDARTTHDLRRLTQGAEYVPIFPEAPKPNDAFYLAFDADHSRHVLAVVVECDVARGAGIRPEEPPLQWEVWQGGPVGSQRWAPCDQEDKTGGFNLASGEVILHVPQMRRGEHQQTTAYWLRCRLTSAQAGTNRYHVSPQLRKLRVEARGATVDARHATTVEDELIGISTGEAGQSWKLMHAPVLDLDPDSPTDYLEVTAPGRSPQRWTEAPDFGESGPDDRHYTLDKLDGTVTFGPALLQPDGNVYRFGETPEKGATLRFTRYQYGGGVMGNVPKDALCVLQSSRPYIKRVTNRASAVGGRNEQSLDDAKVRAAQKLRTRERAVTADDYEYLASAVHGVARAHCLTPGAQPGAPGDLLPGQVGVVVLHQVSQPERYIEPNELTPPGDLYATVKTALNKCCPLGIAVEVRVPRYYWVSVHATLRVGSRSDRTVMDELRQQAESALYRYLNPFTGGSEGVGWPFGRDLHQSEILNVLQRAPLVEFVEDLQLFVSESGAGAGPQVVQSRLRLAPEGLICSDKHSIKVA